MRRDTSDAKNLVAWLREAAREIENAHATLDILGASAKSEDGTAFSLAARIALIAGFPRDTNDAYRERAERAEAAVRELRQFVPYEREERGPLPRWIVDIAARADRVLGRETVADA